MWINEYNGEKEDDGAGEEVESRARRIAGRENGRLATG